MSYTLKLELFYKKTGELFSKVTLFGTFMGPDGKLVKYNPLGRDLKLVSSFNPDLNQTVIIYRVVNSLADNNIITDLQSIPWEGYKGDIKDTAHKVTVLLYNEINVFCDKTSETSNNSQDADDEVE